MSWSLPPQVGETRPDGSPVADGAPGSQKPPDEAATGKGGAGGQAVPLPRNVEVVVLWPILVTGVESGVEVQTCPVSFIPDSESWLWW